MDNETRSATEDTVAEHIPWEQLTVSTPPDRSRLLYGVAAVIGLAVIGVVIGRALRTAPAVPVEPVVAATVAAAAPDPTVVDPTAGAESPAAPSTPDPLSEADLLAFVPVPGDRAAAARAEWFVIDYFGVDGGADRAERVRNAGGWAEAAELPAPVPDSAVSYVEWAEAAAIEQVEPDEFEVTVVFRRYAAADGERFERLPVEAALVRVAVDPVGGSAVLEWPEPVALPEHGAPPGPPDPPGRSITDATGVRWPVGGDQSG
jgi:hypothetical protein